MPRRIYFGTILAELVSQNGQGRFFNAKSTSAAQVYESRRNQIFTITVGRINFDFNLSTQQHEFYILDGNRRELITAGWDGLTPGQQMSIVSELYDFLYNNHMTDATFQDFIVFVSKSPI